MKWTTKMPEVKVKFYASLREEAGKSEVQAFGDTVYQVLEHLGKKLGDRFTGALYENGAPRRYYTLLLNNRIVAWDKIKETGLKAGDIIHIFPPVAGG